MSNSQRNSWGRGNPPPPPYSAYQYNGSEPAPHQSHLPHVNFLPIQPGPPPPQERQALPPIHQNYPTSHVNTIQPSTPQERPLRPSIHQPILAQVNQPTQRVPPEASETAHPHALSPGPSPSPSNGSRPLNVRDALSYLDRVKLEFQNQPEIYNRFLDIMKDFKSQSIDTPGVIDRVSSLFRGYPTLVFGFNTFLPPGFKIEMSSDPSDPNGVRVILPDTSAPVPPVEAEHFGPSLSGPPNTSTHPNYQLPLPYEQGSRASQPPHFFPPVSNYARNDLEAHGMQPPPHHSITPLNHRKPPVEFNHAINYVNRIKNRFSRDPESYKQFLEILQLYQKEQKPIKDIYAQVQLLFGNDTDLLDEFCQFLPDTTGALEASNNLSRASASHYNIPPSHGTHGISLPPIGPSSSRSYQAHHIGLVSHHAGQASSKHGGKFQGIPDGVPPHYGPHPNGHDSYTPRMPLVGPSKPDASVLGPALPSLASGSKKKRGPFVADKASTQAKIKKPKTGTLKPKDDEMESNYAHQEAYESQFARQAALVASPETFEKFESIKKYINHLPTYHEFLKVLNLYKQTILDLDSLLVSVEVFIGGNSGLFNWFKSYVGFTPKSEPVTYGIPRPRIDLKYCRPVGISYRLLPNSETKSVCSGRDELCNEVLNDIYASHSLWATEEFSFATPKKLANELLLTKTEEERFELDFALETNSHAITLMDSLAKELSTMTPEQQASWRLPLGLGGDSITIYRRAIFKLYESEAPEVFELLHSSPARAIPVVLRRLKQKDLEWREKKRELAKFWCDSDTKNYHRSLDYHSSVFKGGDRKYILPRSLATEIEDIKHNELHENDSKFGNPHLNFAMPDTALHKDMLRLINCTLNSNTSLTVSDRIKTISMIRELFRHFFGSSAFDYEHASEGIIMTEDGEQVYQSKFTTPKACEPNDETGDSVSWEKLEVDSDAGLAVSFKHPAQILMFCNQHIYTILRLYQILYTRLAIIKEKSSQANIFHQSVAKKATVASTLDLLPKFETLNGVNLSTIDCYQEFLNITEGLIDCGIEQQAYEDTVRYLFGNKIYCVFTLDKILVGFCKQAGQILLEQNRSSLELIQYFNTLRQSSTMITVSTLAKYREDILPFIPNEENLYLVEYSSRTKSLAFQLFEQNELGCEYLRALETPWAEYCARFSEDTSSSRVTRRPYAFLRRSKSKKTCKRDLAFSPGLKPSICATTFRLHWPRSSQQESIIRLNQELKRTTTPNPREERWKKLLAGPSGWSRHLTKPSKAESHCRRWLQGKTKSTLIRVDRAPSVASEKSNFNQTPMDLGV